MIFKSAEAKKREKDRKEAEEKQKRDLAQSDLEAALLIKRDRNGRVLPVKEYTDDDIGKIENAMQHVSNEDFKKVMDSLTGHKNNEIFKNLIEKDESLAIRNINNFHELNHEALNSVLDHSNAREAATIKAGMEAGVFNIKGIESKISKSLEKAFDTYSDEKTGEYDYRKAVNELTKVGINSDSFALSNDNLLSVLEQGGAKWIKKHHEIFDTKETGQYIKDDLKNPDEWKPFIEAGFTEHILSGTLNTAGEKTVEKEVLDAMITDLKDPTEETIKGITENHKKFKVEMNEITRTLIEWVSDTHEADPQKRKENAEAIINSPNSGLLSGDEVNKFIAMGCSECVADNLEKFIGLKEDVLEKMIEEGHLSKITALGGKNFQKFKEVFGIEEVHRGTPSKMLVLGGSDGSKIAGEILKEAAYNLDQIETSLKERTKETVKKVTRTGQTLREKIDEMVSAGSIDENKDIEIKNLVGRDMSQKDIEAVRTYIEAKRVMGGIVEDKVEAIEDAEGSDAEKIANELINLEEMLVNEEVQLKEKTEGLSEKAFKGLKSGWDRLGNENIMKWTGWNPKGKFGAAIGRALSLKTLLFGGLTVGAVVAGGVAVPIVAALKGGIRGFRGLLGATATYDLAKGWMEKNIQKRAGEMASRERKDISVDEVILLKKEFDEFAKEYHSAEEFEKMKGSQEYMNFIDIYKEKVIEFCKDEDKDAEKKLGERMKEAGAGARKKIKAGKWKVFGSSVVAGGAAAFAPEVWSAAPGTEWVEEKAGGLWRGIKNRISWGGGGADSMAGKDQTSPGSAEAAGPREDFEGRGGADTNTDGNPAPEQEKPSTPETEVPKNAVEKYTLEKGGKLSDIIKEAKGDSGVDIIRVVSSDAGEWEFAGADAENIDEIDLNEVLHKEAAGTASIEVTDVTENGERVIEVRVPDGFIDENAYDVSGAEAASTAENTGDTAPNREEVQEPETETQEGTKEEGQASEEQKQSETEATADTAWEYDESKVFSLSDESSIENMLQDNGFKGSGDGDYVYGEDGKDWKGTTVEITTEDGRQYEMSSENTEKGYDEFWEVMQNKDVNGNMTVTNTEDAWVIKVEGAEPDSMEGYAQDSVEIPIETKTIEDFYKNTPKFYQEGEQLIRIEGSGATCSIEDVKKYRPSLFTEDLSKVSSVVIDNEGVMVIEGVVSDSDAVEVQIDKKDGGLTTLLKEIKSIRGENVDERKLGAIAGFVDAMTADITDESPEKINKIRSALTKELADDNYEKIEKLVDAQKDISPRKGETLKLYYNGNNEEMYFGQYAEGPNKARGRVVKQLFRLVSAKAK